MLADLTAINNSHESSIRMVVHDLNSKNNNHYHIIIIIIIIQLVSGGFVSTATAVINL